MEKICRLCGLEKIDNSIKTIDDPIIKKYLDKFEVLIDGNALLSKICCIECTETLCRFDEFISHVCAVQQELDSRLKLKREEIVPAEVRLSNFMNAL